MNTAPAKFKFMDQIIDVLAMSASVMICALVLVIGTDIAARNLRLFAMPWTLDVAEYLLYLITFFGAPWVLRDQGHIAVDILVARLQPGNRVKVGRFANFLGSLTCTILCVIAAMVFLRSYRNGTMVHETFVFPEWWLLTIAPPVFLLLAMVFVRWLIWGQAETQQQSDGL